MDAVALNDVSTAVTEASNNVVLHAYEGAEGPLEVELSIVPGGVDAVVRDRGVGIRPGVKSAEELSGGIGLPVIQALSESVEFRDLSSGGTEVAMHFDAVAANPPVETDGEEGAALEAIDHGTPRRSHRDDRRAHVRGARGGTASPVDPGSPRLLLDRPNLRHPDARGRPRRSHRRRSCSPAT